MLSESAKQRLINAVGGMIDNYGAEKTLELFGDPAEHLTQAIACNPEHPDAISLSDNREEAERMIAGMLGLM